jgi:thymidylate synthase
LDKIKEILEKGVQKGDRTGVGTRSIFGGMMRYDLSETFPLLTTKNTFMRGVAEELLWFI